MRQARVSMGAGRLGGRVSREGAAARGMLTRLRAAAPPAPNPLGRESPLAGPGPVLGRKVNFSAGPACLYEDVLLQAQAEMLSFGGTSGLGVMEMSHRGKLFVGIRDKAESDLRQLLGLSDDFAVLFLQGGASTQFAALAANLASQGQAADYLVSGSWSKKAFAEGTKVGLDARVCATGDNKSVPAFDTWQLSDPSQAAFTHMCTNETIQGVEVPWAVVGQYLSSDHGKQVPLVADMSSHFLSKPIDRVNEYGVIYAGAQKNLGPAGVTIVIVKKELMGKAQPGTPTMFDWQTMADNDSLYNTPPCWPIYMCGLVFKKLIDLGGLEEVEKINKAKCSLIYDAIASSAGFYSCPVDPAVRSAMNVPFTIPAGGDLEKAFVAEAEAEGLINLKGHRSVGGMRASIYNAMPIEGVQKLVRFMEEFAARNA